MDNKINHYNQNSSFYPNLNDYLQNNNCPQHFTHPIVGQSNIIQPSLQISNPPIPIPQQHHPIPPTQQFPTAPTVSPAPSAPSAPSVSTVPLVPSITSTQSVQPTHQISTQQNTQSTQSSITQLTNNFVNNQTQNDEQKKRANMIRERLRRKQNRPVYQININSRNKTSSLSSQSSDSDINI